MKVHMLQIVLLSTVICVGIAILWIKKENLIKEGFVIQLSTPITKCPNESYAFTNAKGDMDCCSSQPIENVCPSTLCTLSPPHDSVRSCREVLEERFMKRSELHCSKSKPFYFENEDGAGCSPVKPNQNGTLDSSVPNEERCKVFVREVDSYTHKESCILQKFKEEFQCPFPAETTSIAILQSEDKPGIIWCTSVTAEGIKQCGEDKTLLNYLDRVHPTWRNTFSLEQKNLFCSLHKRAQIEGRDITSFEFP
jgi:hypothetical protein